VSADDPKDCSCFLLFCCFACDICRLWFRTIICDKIGRFHTRQPTEPAAVRTWSPTRRVNSPAPPASYLELSRRVSSSVERHGRRLAIKPTPLSPALKTRMPLLPNDPATFVCPCPVTATGIFPAQKTDRVSPSAAQIGSPKPHQLHSQSLTGSPFPLQFRRQQLPSVPFSELPKSFCIVNCIDWHAYHPFRLSLSLTHSLNVWERLLARKKKRSSLAHNPTE